MNRREKEQEKLITESIKKFGDKFNYLKVYYINNDTPVIITCKIHGDTNQKFYNHLKSKNGCSYCREEQKEVDFINSCKLIFGEHKYDYSKVDYINNTTEVLIGYNGIFYNTQPCLMIKGCKPENKNFSSKYSTEQFIYKSNLFHNNKYNYSKVKFNNLKDYVIIICPIHGDFNQIANDHFKHGCEKCGKIEMGKKISNSKEDWIDKIINRHGNKYEYLNLEHIIDRNTILKINCSKHGYFEQTVYNHSEGGCKDCGYEIVSNKLSSIKEEFIEKSNIIHNNKYKYDKVIYNNNNTKVIVTCPIHDDFEQTPNAHLSGSGCIKCGYILVSNKSKMSQEEYIIKCDLVHNKKYNYDKVIYYNSRNKVIITCPIHGDFKQSSQFHMYGGDCPSCNESKGEKSIRIFLEKNNIHYINEYKFDDCKNKLSLPFDFYLPKYNTLIEFDGIQHFEPLEFFGGEKSLEKRKYNDNLKDEYCIMNDISLIRISYKDINNIDNILFNNIKPA